MAKKVLITSIGFSPNVGGIETHFDDLIRTLIKKRWEVVVLTYKPVTTSVQAPFHESRRNLKIYRLPITKGHFYKLVKNPILEFVYLTPILFFTMPLVLLTTARDAKVIHSHGLVAGFVSDFWGIVFRKKVITTTHSIYHFPAKGLYRSFATWIFKNSSTTLTLSNQSKTEVENLGVSSERVKVFTYWIDLQRFHRIKSAKQKLKWNKKFIILFVGRLIKEKGILDVISSLPKWNKKIYLAIAGTGPLETRIEQAAAKNRKIIILGNVSQDYLPLFYSAADMLIVPSTHDEGFGRVILESLACGTPVIGSNRGAIPEAMDENVGKLIKVSPDIIAKTVDDFYKHPRKLKQLKSRARAYAQKHYSDKNAKTILQTYR